MTPLERLQTAIAKLEQLRCGAFAGPWEVLTSGIEHGDHWYVQANHEAILHVSANDGSDEDYRRPTAALIVTLHRTIDAQLAVLRSALDWFKVTEAIWKPQTFSKHPELGDGLASLLQQELALADAINGETP